jgi:glycosyltransferase involved in cell wall biosynthesis
MHSLPQAINPNAVLPWEDGLEIQSSHKDLPTVSIVIPIFNAGNFIEKTIRSLLCNDMSGVELILMDGGSNDATMEIVRHYESFFSVTHSAPDKGQSDAINRGFEKATGEIFYWLNGDDLLLPNTLNRVRACFSVHPACDVLVGNAFMTELDLTPINHFIYSNEKLSFDYLLDYASHHLIQPGVFFSRNAWETCGPVNNDYHYAMDADLFIGMANKFQLQHLDLDIAYSVYHEACKTRDARAESISELALVQASHGGFTQAQSTLKLLVDLYNQAKTDFERNSAIASASNSECTKCLALHSQVIALENTINENKQMYLEIDLMEES